ncbi:3-hydroxyisobutyrate dehydrogenase-like beta-hydroxyacid dehydrogenase [Bradyrhizobium sp. LM3.4]
MAGEILGVIGTGRMGGPMAGRLMDAGYSLVIYDTQVEATQPLVKRGALLAKSPADVASRADIVLASLPTPDIVKAVTLGQDGISSGNRAKIVIDLSTSGPGTAKFVAEGLKAKGMQLVDAPVSGGIKGAVNGTLAVMVSCPQATYETVQPILKNFGKLFYTGDKPGVAQTAKLANNLMAAAALVITSEAVAMGVKGGVNAKVLIDIINASSGRNSASEDKFPPRGAARHLRFRLHHRPFLQGCPVVRGRSRGHGCADGLRRGGAADARDHQRQIRRVVRFHLDRQGARGVGRRRDAWLIAQNPRGERLR